MFASKNNVSQSVDWLAWCWLALGAALLPFTSFQTMLPLAAWLAPIFILRFARSQRVWVSLPLVLLTNSLAVAIATRNLLPTDSLIVAGAISAGYGLILTVSYSVDRLLAPRLSGLARTLVFPCAVVSVELLMALFHPIYSTWGALAYTQYGNLPLLQIISVTGIWGVSFLIAWGAAVVNHAWEQGFTWTAHRLSTTLFVSVLLAVLLFGSVRLAFFLPEGPSVRIAALAPDETLFSADMELNLTPGTDADRAVARAAFAPQVDDLFTRTQQEARAGAKIVAWPEGATLALKEDEAELIERAQTLAREERIYLQMGVVTFLRTDRFPFRENRAILVDPSGAIVWDYYKSIQVPGGDASYMADGPGLVPTASTPYGRLATVICFDADFPILVRQAGQARTDLLLVPSSDWETVAETHAQMHVFRAIENGVTLVRPTRQGLSIATDYLGRVLGQADSFTTAKTVMVAAVPTQGVPTIYARIGDSFAYLCVAGLVILAGAALSRQRVVAAPSLGVPVKA
jgi:apolipoprotein N-acyltransferase